MRTYILLCLSFSLLNLVTLVMKEFYLQTDQGAPLTKDNELVGIASFDVDCSPNIPNVYLRVYDYKGWITGHMN